MTALQLACGHVLDVDAVVTVKATCRNCEWAATMTGPAGEVAVFLRARAIEHIAERHPEELPPNVEDLPVRDLGIV
ncbi:MAG TPA: hypothetical protein VGR63_13075 [Casimicrobiaceae bacterium]|nr:hypothetical protein [Casimicrobiaceae bacterium]